MLLLLRMVLVSYMDKKYACVNVFRQQMVIHLRRLCVPRWWCSYTGSSAPYVQPMLCSAQPNRAACDDKQLSERPRLPRLFPKLRVIPAGRSTARGTRPAVCFWLSQTERIAVLLCFHSFCHRCYLILPLVRPAFIHTSFCVSWYLMDNTRANTDGYIFGWGVGRVWRCRGTDPKPTEMLSCVLWVEDVTKTPTLSSVVSASNLLYRSTTPHLSNSDYFYKDFTAAGVRIFFKQKRQQFTGSSFVNVGIWCSSLRYKRWTEGLWYC